MLFLTREAAAAKVAAAAGTKLVDVAVRSVRGIVRRDAAAAVDGPIGEATKRFGGDAIAGRFVPFVLSAGERVDDGLKVDPAGWDLEQYDRVPHVMWQHMWWGSRARIADSYVYKEPDQLCAVAAFYSRDFSQALDGGFSWAVGELAGLRGYRASVGFEIVEAALADEATRKVIPWALDVSVARLHEWSIVNLGMDPEGVSAGRAAGLDTQPIANMAAQLLDEGGMRAAIRAEVEAVLAAARTKPSSTISSPAAAAVRAVVGEALAPLGGQLPRPAR